MADHTPGPWTLLIEDHQPASEWFAADISVGSPWDGSHRSLASVPQADPHWDADAQARTLADARLIAAAPDLLAVLETFVKANGRLHDGSDQCCTNCGLVAEARAAIAKARGEATDVS